MNKLQEVTYVCKECSSEDVERLAWIDLNHKPLNENYITQWEDNDGTNENYWCNDCVEHFEVIIREEI